MEVDSVECLLDIASKVEVVKTFNEIQSEKMLECSNVFLELIIVN